MNFKSYLLENDYLKISKTNSILFFGENIGLKRFYKQFIKDKNSDALFISFFQDEVLKNKKIFDRQLENPSLFEKKKIIFLEECNDKILDLLQNYFENDFNFQIFIFSNLLDKKSKLRNLYEKSKTLLSVACYPDDINTIRKIIIEKLKDFRGLGQDNINIIVETCALDRIKLENEIKKIETFFHKKIINTKDLIKLLNDPSTEDFNELKDEAIKGNRIRTNNLLSNTVIEPDKFIYYLTLINQRLLKLQEVYNMDDKNNLDMKMSSLKPPIFWKDKKNFLAQINKWKINKTKEALLNTYNLEIELKSNSSVNKSLIIKKQIVDLCILANS